MTAKHLKQLSQNYLNVTGDIPGNFVNRIPSWLTITVKHVLLKLYLIYKQTASWGRIQGNYCDYFSREKLYWGNYSKRKIDVNPTVSDCKGKKKWVRFFWFNLAFRRKEYQRKKEKVLSICYRVEHNICN